MPSLQALKAFYKMRIERNENGRLEGRIALLKPKAMDTFAIAELDMQALVALDDPFGGQGLGRNRQAIIEAPRRRRDDQRRRIDLRQPDRIGFCGGLVRVSRETKRPIAG
ncbi:hypothetical protein QBK93_24180 [Rhizobium leguminosarum]|nr:hypothetical protein [Rhizobium leguminosarum]MDI5927766.1 hypothetical protein [Rhizobium leguminosarum]